MANQEVTELRNRILGILIRTTRERARASRRECAAVLGIPDSRFAHYEEGSQPISLPEMELLARYLEAPLSTFLQSGAMGDRTGNAALPNPDLFLPLRHRVVGARLRQLRQDEDHTQEDIAEMVGCSASTISDYEYGQRGIAMADLEIICRGLGVTLEYFRDRESEVGKWHSEQEEFEQFTELPDDIREFVLKPINLSYLELAMKLSEMTAGRLRSIAEGILEITY
jgi:transcriptional regulator with XRE-family HTH domain